jgi:hypothetical protein
MNIVNELTYDGEIYRWTGSLSELKTFVEKTLKEHGLHPATTSNFLRMMIQI